MIIPFEHKAFAGRGLAVRTAGIFTGPRLIVDGGEAREKERLRYLLRDNGGLLREVRLKSNRIDPVPTVHVGKQTIVLAPPLTWRHYLCIALPFGLGFLSGGALGALVGLACVRWSAKIFRSARGRAAQYGLSALTSLMAVVGGSIVGAPSHDRPVAGTRPTAPPPRPEVANTAPPRVWISQRSPNALGQHIDSLPHRAREWTMTNGFVGNWIHWTGVVRSLDTANNHYHVGTVSSLGRSYAYAVLEFPIDQGPVVNQVKRGDFVVYSGRLREPIRAVFTKDLIAFVVDSVTLLETVPESGGSAADRAP